MTRVDVIQNSIEELINNHLTEFKQIVTINMQAEGLMDEYDPFRGTIEQLLSATTIEEQ